MGNCSAKNFHAHPIVKTLLDNHETYIDDLGKIHDVLCEVVPYWDQLDKKLRSKVKYLESIYFNGRKMGESGTKKTAELLQAVGAI
jgi:hypothetical protein